MVALHVGDNAEGGAELLIKSLTKGHGDRRHLVNLASFDPNAVPELVHAVARFVLQQFCKLFLGKLVHRRHQDNPRTLVGALTQVLDCVRVSSSDGS